MSGIKYLLFACCIPILPLHAQEGLPTPKNIRAAYDNHTRSYDGRPGPKYWQNSASYNIDIHFNPATRRLSGTVDIVYKNNSPDTLKQILFKLYPNLYKKGVPRLMSVDSNDLTNGVEIQSMSANGTAIAADKQRISGTNMTVPVPPVRPGTEITFHIAYAYTLNKHSHIRTGEIEPGADFIAYFFPRVAVYDDVDGWNRYPYLGNLEFYNDFCHFKASITVPNNQVVWATGTLQNPADVLAASTYERLKSAEKNDALVTIVDSTEYRTATNHANAENTWVFVADSVSDLVFACSDHYMWQSSSLVVDPATARRTRVDAVFNPIHKDYFKVLSDARKTVESMSYRFPKWPYPYPHETVFDGLDQMEYPMMVNDNPVEDREESIELTDHEIFHTMFPFYMGVNETKYAWMDEGWATIGEWLISPMIDSSLVDLYGVGPVEMNAGKETDLPIITLSTETNAAYFTNSYPKPAMGYLFAKDLLGDDLFFKGLHYYFTNWHGRHPLPYDFFNCMNKGSGKDLNWFWRKWFFENGEPDLAIQKVVNNGVKPSVTIQMKGSKPVPVDLVITYSDGTVTQLHRSVEAWSAGHSTVTIPVTPAKKIKKIVLGSAHVPDSNKKDNTWGN
jgi:hypothetical protein